MKKWIMCLIFLWLGLSPARAQEKLEFFGYFESQYLGIHLNKSYSQLFTNKLRLDLKSNLSEHITMAANFDYITFHGKTEWNVLDYLIDDIVSEISGGMQSLYVIRFENETFLDNAYIRFSYKPFDLTVGKQQISLGTGYVWNPTDVFNIKDVLDPTYEQPGHNAIRLDVPMGAQSYATVLYSPEDSWKTSTKLAQFSGHWSRFDYSLIVVETEWILHDYTQFDFAESKFVALPEQRQLLGGSTAGEVLGLGVWAEYAYNWMEFSENYYELVVGGDYTFDFQTYVMGEYYRNTLAKPDLEDYDLNDWMRFFATEVKTIARDQVYVLVQHPASNLLDIGIQNIWSVSDGSMALAPTLNYSLSDNVELFGYLNFSIGAEGTAYGNNMGNGGLLRIRVYF